MRRSIDVGAGVRALAACAQTVAAAAWLWGCSHAGAASDGDAANTFYDDDCGVPLFAGSCSEAGGFCATNLGDGAQFQCPFGSQEIPGTIDWCTPECQEGPPLGCCVETPDAAADVGAAD